MANGFPAAQIAPAPAPGYLDRSIPAARAVDQYVEVPGSPGIPGEPYRRRLKTNAEWLADVETQANAAYDAVVARLTNDRIDALHSSISHDRHSGGVADADQVNEYATLVAG